MIYCLVFCDLALKRSALVSSSNQRRRVAAILDWMDQSNATVAFTGSVRQCLEHPSGAREQVTPSAVGKSAKEFNERLSRHLLGRSAVRIGTQLRFACAVEGGGQYSDKRVHAHMMLGGFPEHVSFSTTKAAMEERWASSRWGYRNVDVQPLVSDEDRRRWAIYLVKDLGLDGEERWFFNYAYHRP